MENSADRRNATVAVVILTLNEEANLGSAIESVQGWADEIVVLDSFSTDSTIRIAEERGCVVVQNRFVDYGSQRNFAISSLPIKSEWILFLDADEIVPHALREEVSLTIASQPLENGFYLRFRLIWMGKWIRRGYYPTWILRLFRRQHGRCESRTVNEHLVVEGTTGFLQNDIIHEDRKGIRDWLSKHESYARKEATEMRKKMRKRETEPATFLEKLTLLRGSQAMRKRWVREEVWDRMPLLLRPFAYFGYRYFLRGGFLDGKEAFTFHFLHGLWFPMLIDIHALELERKDPGGGNRSKEGTGCHRYRQSHPET